MPTTKSVLPAVAELIRALPIASAIVDRDLRFVAVNERWCIAYGLGDSSPIGKSWYDVFPGMPGEWKDVFDRCLAGDAERRCAQPFQLADGSMGCFDWNGAPWRNTEREIAGLVIQAELVTEQGPIRDRLDEEQAFVRAFVAQSPVGLNLCDLSGVWIESNPAFLEIIGYSKEEADGGLSYWDLTPREYDDAEEEQLKALTSTGRYGPYEKEFIRKDGSRIPVRLNGFIITRNDKQYIWSLIEDMTDQRQLEANLTEERCKSLQAAKLASIGETAAGVAHEINNPLQLIEGSAFALQQALEAGEAPPLGAVKDIRKATERAAEIVRALRRFAREERAEVDLHPVEWIVGETLTLTANRMRNNGVELQSSVKSQRAIRCSALELTQVLVNLLNNAFDAVREERGLVRLIVSDDESFVIFCVEDSGPGVDQALRKTIFEPFVTSKSAGEGTGLGLSISRGIVESMGGTLTYERKGNRTQFIARVPAASGS